MARVGNEAKLILKLTDERAKQAAEYYRKQASANVFTEAENARLIGKAEGIAECLHTHAGVILELES